MTRPAGRWRAVVCVAVLLAGTAGAAAPARAADGDRVLTLIRRIVDLSAGKEVARTMTDGNKVAIDLSSDVLFAFGAATLSSGSQQTLQRASDELGKAKAGTVRVDGYTDAKGSDAVNVPLSQQRAQAVAEALTRLAGSRFRFQVSGHGSADPVAPNSRAGADNPAGRALNRRVTLSFQRS